LKFKFKTKFLELKTSIISLFNTTCTKVYPNSLANSYQYENFELTNFSAQFFCVCFPSKNLLIEEKEDRDWKSKKLRLFEQKERLHLLSFDWFFDGFR
jgi:hypothetical protein